MGGAKLTVAVVLIAVLGSVLIWKVQPETDHETVPSASSPVRMLSRDAALSDDAMLSGAKQLAGFPRVTGPRPFQFPADHGPHPAFRHEWWYLTGNLTAPDGRRFGYQLTFFRFADTPEAPESKSAWATNQLYMAHFALTDVHGKQFHTSERFSRGALGLAGTQASPFRLWLDDWKAQGAGEPFPLQLRAAQDDVKLALTLHTDKPPVLQGDRGYSRKGGDPGNASHYYSFTRLPTAGAITIGGERYAVAGQSWLDHEWGSSALSADLVGWDWFSLQLDDGRELMFFHLRHADGTIDPLSHGSLVDSDGRVQPLTLDDVEASPLSWWKSTDGQRRYPVAWRLRVPREHLDLVLRPRLKNQEWTGTFRYWEGAMEVSGTSQGEPVAGVGYLELTGY